MRVLLLGGYGQFGARVAGELAGDQDIELWIAGRDAARAAVFAAGLRGRARAAGLDATAADLPAQVSELAPQLVIHAAGPFQGRDYRVAQAAIACGAHYVDLADAREFVCGIGALDAAARERGVLVASGASTVPAISCAVVDAFAESFGTLETVDIGISPGNRTPRGLATVAAILHSVGRPFRWWEGCRWRHVHGWQRLRRWRYPAPVGARWHAACDVPDLDLFPARYPGSANVRFRAGLELRTLHFGLWVLSWLARSRLVSNWSAHATALKRMSDWFERNGTDAGAMYVELRGLAPDGQPRTVRWQMLAERGDGPQIPATPAVVIARKLARGEIVQRGAMPCLGLMTLAEVLDALQPYAVRCIKD